jgi:hypothetical protein
MRKMTMAAAAAGQETKTVSFHFFMMNTFIN